MEKFKQLKKNNNYIIDLTNILSSNVEKIELDDEVLIPNNYFNSEIHDLSLIKFKGFIKKINDDLTIIMNISGKMKISDSITLEDVWYPFEIEIDEKLDEFIEKNEKKLDIIEFLWQNIVLEVPLRYTLVDDYSNYLGDGWKLVGEEKEKNNPFLALLNNEDRSD